MSKICKVDGCGSTKDIRRGYCYRHWRQMYRTGKITNVAKKRTPEFLVEKFEAKYKDLPNRCWKYDKQNLAEARRIAMYSSNRRQPIDKPFISNTCRTKNCVNPAHLEFQDADKKYTERYKKINDSKC